MANRYSGDTMTRETQWHVTAARVSLAVKTRRNNIHMKSLYLLRFFTFDEVFYRFAVDLNGCFFIIWISVVRFHTLPPVRCVNTFWRGSYANIGIAKELTAMGHPHFSANILPKK